MSAERRLAEARVVFGLQAVEEALTDPLTVAREVARSPRRVQDAVRALQGMLPERLQDAASYASNLPPPLRLAVAGLWCGDSSARRVMRRGGLELRGGDDA